MIIKQLWRYSYSVPLPLSVRNKIDLLFPVEMGSFHTKLKDKHVKDPAYGRVGWSLIRLETKGSLRSAVSALRLPSVGEAHSCFYQAQEKAKMQKFWTAVQSLSPFRWVSLCSCLGPGALLPCIAPSTVQVQAYT